MCILAWSGGSLQRQNAHGGLRNGPRPGTAPTRPQQPQQHNYMIENDQQPPRQWDNSNGPSWDSHQLSDPVLSDILDQVIDIVPDAIITGN